MNQTLSISYHCLKQVCPDRGGDVAAGVIVTMLLTALTVAGVSVAVQLALYIWFYKPRMMSGTKGPEREEHPYEDMSRDEDESQDTDTKDVQLKKNKAYQKHTRTKHS